MHQRDTRRTSHCGVRSPVFHGGNWVCWKSVNLGPGLEPYTLLSSKKSPCEPQETHESIKSIWKKLNGEFGQLLSIRKHYKQKELCPSTNYRYLLINKTNNKKRQIQDDQVVKCHKNSMNVPEHGTSQGTLLCAGGWAPWRENVYAPILAATQIHWWYYQEFRGAHRHHWTVPSHRWSAGRYCWFAFEWRTSGPETCHKCDGRQFWGGHARADPRCQKARATAAQICGQRSASRCSVGIPTTQVRVGRIHKQIKGVARPNQVQGRLLPGRSRGYQKGVGFERYYTQSKTRIMQKANPKHHPHMVRI